MTPPLKFTLLVGFVLSLAFGGYGCSEPGSQSNDTVSDPGGPAAAGIEIRNVTVIDPENRSVTENRSVFIQGDRIIAVLPSTETGSYVAGQIIDGTGKYLIPGLMDMHAHIGIMQGRAEPSLALLLANGVTGIRDPFGDCWEPREETSVCIDELRFLGREIELGNRIGPHILSLSSALVRGMRYRQSLPEGSESFYYPQTPEEARRLVRYLKDRGVDFIKTYNLIPRDAYFALAEEAQSLGLQFAGHVPAGVSVVEASNAGHKTIEHARAILYDCSRFGTEFRPFMAQVADAGLSDDGSATASWPNSDRLRRTIEDFDQNLCEDLLGILRDNGTHYVPTHLTREMDARASDPAYRNDVRFKYLDQALRDGWDEDLDRTASASQEEIDLYRRFFDHGLMITRLAHEMGVKVLVGTDANDTMVFPGFSVHDEMAHFAEAGLQPMDILRAATTLPAEYLGRTEAFGGIAVGKAADLVLLDADPLENINNTRSIAWVFFSGRAFDRRELDEILEGVEDFAVTDSSEKELISLAIHDVTVIDPESEDVLPGQSVYIDGDRIREVIPSSIETAYVASRTIDGGGKYLIPGLLDMHVHMGFRPWLPKHSLDLFIANGVTGVRDMLADCVQPNREGAVCIEDMRALQERIETRDVLGPRLLRLASSFVFGPMIGQVLDDGDPVKPDSFALTEEDGRQLARDLKSRGVDLIKVGEMIPAEAFFGMADEANKIGLEFSGHMPGPQTVAEVSALGQRTIEHARELLYDCSASGPAYRESQIPFTRLKPGQGIWRALLNGGMPMSKEEKLRGSVEEFEADRCQKMFDAMVTNDTYYVPTHLTRMPESFADEIDYLADPRMKYIAAPLRANWQEDLDEVTSEKPEIIDLHKKFYEHGLKITRLAHEAGVKIMVGTDANDATVFPGFSVHDEMQQFQKAGITPMDILRAATTVPAEYLDRSADLGGIASGKMADLILLERNPLEDIGNTQSIATVIYDGQLFERQALDGLLDKMDRLAATGNH